MAEVRFFGGPQDGLRMVILGTASREFRFPILAESPRAILNQSDLEPPLKMHVLIYRLLQDGQYVFSGERDW